MAASAIGTIGFDKRFGVVHANKSDNEMLEKGTIHGTMSRNGAGKSALLSIVCGSCRADARAGISRIFCTARHMFRPAPLLRIVILTHATLTSACSLDLPYIRVVSAVGKQPFNFLANQQPPEIARRIEDLERHIGRVGLKQFIVENQPICEDVVDGTQTCFYSVRHEVVARVNGQEKLGFSIDTVAKVIYDIGKGKGLYFVPSDPGQAIGSTRMLREERDCIADGSCVSGWRQVYPVPAQ